GAPPRPGWPVRRARRGLPLEGLLGGRHAVGAPITAPESSAPPAAGTTTARPAAASRPASTGARCLGCGEIHGELAPVEVLAVELRDGALSLLGSGHLDETEAAGLSGELVGDDRRGLHGAALGKIFPQRLARRRVRQPAHIEFGSHADLLAVALPP